MPVFLSFFPKNRHFEMGSNCDVLTLKRTSFSTFFVVGRSNHLPTTSAFFRQIPSVAIYTKKLEINLTAMSRGFDPPSAPRAVPCGVLLFIFVANYARVARWDSNSPCPALCVPRGCNSPADCCKGAGESHRLRQVSLLNFTLGSNFFIAALQNPRAFLIDISPLFSSSDFRVRYKSYQQSRQIAIHRTTQDSSAAWVQIDSKKAAPDFSDAAAVQITTSLWAALRAVSVC